jgi:16S rRNA C1402 N4-methylase RsmH
MSGTQEGALIGAGSGAALGSIIGHSAGNTGAGAGIGTVVGGLAGGLVGTYNDKKAVQIVKVYVNNKLIGDYNVNDSYGYSKIASLLTNNHGVAVISGPMAATIKSNLLTLGVSSTQLVISERGDYNNRVYINF